MIDASEAEVLERTFTQSFNQALASATGIEIAASYLIEQILELFV